MKKIVYILILIFPIFIGEVAAQSASEYVTVQAAPEEDVQKIQEQSAKYIDLRLHKIEKLYKQQDKQIKKSLKRLAKKEKRLKAKYKKKDSLLRAKLKGSTSFDSLKKSYASKKSKSGKKKVNRSVSKSLDSVTVIKNFASKKLALAKQKGLIGKDVNLPADKNSLNDLKAKLAAQQEIQQLAEKHAKRLKSAIGSIGNKADVKGLSKELFYFKGKIQAYKNIAKEPEKLEELALEYLQGTQGFESALSSGLRKQSTQGGVSLQDMKPEDLERMGFQTKKSVRKQIKKKFNLNSSEKVNAFKNKTAEAKKEFNKLKKQKSEIKKQKEQFKKEGFRPNPMRGLPFSKRIEKNFNWQVNRAANGEPALANFAVQVGFKHTQRLTYNLLAGTAIGLGQDIRNIKITYQGVRAGTNIDWKWTWGISAQLGYEVLFKEYTNTYFEQTETQLEPQVITQSKQLRHTSYAGLMKTYKINKKYNGTILIGYDFLWNKYNKQSPLIIRFGWKK